MMKSSAKALKWTSLMSSVAVIAMSASAFASTHSASAVAVVSGNLQIAEGQQPDKKLPPPQNAQRQTQQQQPKQPLHQEPKQPPQQQAQQQPKQPLQQQSQPQSKQPQQQQASSNKTSRTAATIGAVTSLVIGRRSGSSTARISTGSPTR